MYQQKNNRVTYIKLIACFLLAFILFSCANQVPPTGGPKDETPPRLMSSIPKDSLTNYKGRLLVFEFDELIKLNNLKKELIISPNTDLKYKTRIKKNQLFIELLNPLNDSTTYTFNFGKGIGDITEGNPVDSLKIAFSTWDILDTLSIKGELRNLETGKPINGALISLYYQEDTTKIFDNGKPAYYTFTNEEGKYELTNLSPKPYTLYGLLDNNKNFMHDGSKELIAYLQEDIQLESTLDSLVLLANSFDDREFVYKGVKSRKGFLEVTFSKGLKSYFFKMEKNIDSIYNIRKNDKLIVFYDGSQVFTDSLEFSMQATDSVGNTLKIEDRFLITEEKRGKMEIPDFNYSVSQPTTNSFKEGEEVATTLFFSRPVNSFSLDSAYLIKGNDTTEIASTDYQWNDNRTLLSFRKISIDSTMRYEFKKGAFISVLNDTLAQKSITYSVKDPTKHGSIEGTIETDKPNFFVQLLNESNKVEAEVKNQKKFLFELVKPGIKKIRVFSDENDNGVWDKGDLFNRIPAEQVTFYPSEIEVKENWEIMDENLVIELK